MLEEREIMSCNKNCQLSAKNLKPHGTEVSQKNSQAPDTKTLKPHGTYLYLSLYYIKHSALNFQFYQTPPNIE